MDNYTETIDLSELSNGIYFIEISVNNVIKTHKLIKK